MTTLLIRNVGKVRRATLNGRKYLVANTTIIVPGVLNGSKGALYYPPEEVAHPACVDAWNGIPLVNGHPTDENGQHVSARSPEIMESHGLGHVFKSRIDPHTGSQRVQAWFDVEAMRRVEPRILDALERGKPVEVSTGLYTQDEPAPAGSVHNGREYQYVARKYRPDHLAILIDQEGACSLRDGCGVMVENNKTLTDNCGGKGGKPGPCPKPESDSVSRGFDPTVDLTQVDPRPRPGRESEYYRTLRRDAARLSDLALAAGKDIPPTDDTAKLDNASQVASKLADRGGKVLPGRTMGGRHSSLHKKAASAHAKASTAHRAASSRLAIFRPDAALRHAKAAEAHGLASAAHTKAGNELMITGNRMTLAESALMKLNCGGKGGKPGPCPLTKDEEEQYATDYRRIKKEKRRKKLDKIKAEIDSIPPLKIKTTDNARSGTDMIATALNCGGKGGKPGPCPTGKNAGAPLSDNNRDIEHALDSGKVTEDDFNSHNTGAQKARDAEGVQVGSPVRIDPKVGGGTGHVVGFDREGSFAYVKVKGEVKSFHNSDLKRRTARTSVPGSVQVRGFTARNSNHEGRTMAEKKLTKPQLVEFLTTNCECWKPKAASKTLATLNEAQLAAMVTAEQERAAANQLATAVRNRLGEKAATLTVNQLAETLEDEEMELDLEIDDDSETPAENCDSGYGMESGGAAAEEEETEGEDEAAAAEAPPAPPFGKKKAKKKGPPMAPPTGNESTVGVSLQGRRLTMNEWEAIAPIEVLERDRRAKQVVNGERDRIITKLVANSSARSKDQKDQLRKFLGSKSLDDLNAMSLLSVNRKAETREDERRAPDYGGLGHSYEDVTANSDGYNEDGSIAEEDGDTLTVPTVNWADEVKLFSPKARTA